MSSDAVGDRRHQLQYDHADVTDDVADDRRKDERDDVDRVHDNRQAEDDRFIDVEKARSQGHFRDRILGFVPFSDKEDGDDQPKVAPEPPMFPKASLMDCQLTG